MDKFEKAQEKFLKASKIEDRLRKLELLKVICSKPQMIEIRATECSKSGCHIPYVLQTSEIKVGYEPELLEEIKSWAEIQYRKLKVEFQELM